MTRLSKYCAAFAVIAVVAATSAGAAALITGKEVRNHSLTGADLELRTLAVKHLTTAAREKLAIPSLAFAFHLKAGEPVIGQASSSVGQIDLPVGSYVVTAKAVLVNTGAVTAQPNCELGTLDGPSFRQIDQVEGPKLTPTATEQAALPITLLGAVTVATPVKLELRCTPGAGQTFLARDRTIIATQVAELR